MIFLSIGAVIMAIGLELILVPNQIMDGGVVGISIMLSHLTNWKLGMFIFLLNIPFFYLGYKQIGKSFTLSTIYGISVLSLSTYLLHGFDPFTKDPLLATVSGGVVIGIGIGIAIRMGGCLDGTETLAILINKKLPFSVGEIIMFFNLFILGSAGFIFGLDRALYSLLAYYIAFKTIDVVVEGLNESKSVLIISDHYEEIAEQMINRLGRGVTYLNGKGAYSKGEKQVIYCIITRLEEAKVKKMVEAIDPLALIAISNVSEVSGGSFKKKDIH